MSTQERRAPFVHRLTVRYSETDQMGVVHHANFLVYLEEARTAVLKKRASSYGSIEGTGIGLPVRHIDIRYRTPAFFEDELAISVWIERVRGASVTFGYEVRRDDGAASPTLLATATVELACFDLATRKPRLFPEELREAFQRSAGRPDERRPPSRASTGPASETTPRPD